LIGRFATAEAIRRADAGRLGLTLERF